MAIHVLGAILDVVLSLGSTTPDSDAYQNAKVQKVIATAMFCVGIPTSDTTAMPIRMPFRMVAAPVFGGGGFTRSTTPANMTTHSIHPMLPMIPFSASCCRYQFCALSAGTFGLPM